MKKILFCLPLLLLALDVYKRQMVWPMSIMMKAFTSQNDEEIKICIKMLMDTDAGTGFMHESFHKDDPLSLIHI